MKNLAAVALVVLVVGACSPLKVSVRSDTAETGAPPVATYLEPFTETADLEMRSTSNGNTTVYYKDKPFFASVETLHTLYKRAKGKLDGGTLKPLSEARNDVGVVRVVRTTITKHAVLSDTSVMQFLIAFLPCAFGCPFGVLYPLIVPSETEQTVDGVIQVFEIDGVELERRLVAVPGRTDPYLNTEGLRPATQRDFTLRLHGEVGMLGPREPNSLIDPVTAPLLNEIRAATSGSAPKPEAPASTSTTTL